MKTDNELIAEFMGLRFRKSVLLGGVYVVMNDDGEDCLYSENNLEYNSSWDWLMPVVQRIEKLMPSINIPRDLEALKNGVHGSEKHMDVIALPLSVDISEAYRCIVEFIKWHNENKQT